jgi:hypothetical protein
MNTEKPDESIVENPTLDTQLTSANLYGQVKNQTQIPVDTAFQNSYHEYFNGETLNSPVQETARIPKPGAIESIKQGFNKINDISLLYDYQKNNAGSDNPLNDFVPPDYNPKNDLAQVGDIDQQYAGYLLEATSPKDFQRRKYQVYDLMYNNELYEKGSMGYHASGMILGGLLSPTTWIPLGLEAKSARLSVRLAQDIPRIIPGVAASAALHEAIVQTDDVNGNLKSFAEDTFRDTIFGTAFMGTMMGIGHGYTAGKIWNARRVVNNAYDDIGVEPIINEDGSFSGRLTAKPLNEAASADKVELAQKFADSTMAKEGLFAVPVLGDMLTKGIKPFNPIIRMMTSPSEVMRAFIDRAADHGIATEGNQKSIASPEKFEVKMAIIQGENKHFMWWLKGLHLERNGIDPTKRIRGAFKETALRLKKDDQYISPEQFMDEIEGVIINGVDHNESSVNLAARAITERQDASYKAYREAFNLPEDWLPPKTAKGYLSRVYDLDYMLTHKNEWRQIVGDYLKKSDQLINSKMQPINELERTISDFEERHKDLIKELGSKSKEKKENGLIKISKETGISKPNPLLELTSMRAKLKSMKENLQNEIRENPELHIHADDITAFSAKESEQLKSILKPLTAINKRIEEHEALIAATKKESSKKLKSAKMSKTENKAKPKAEEFVSLEERVADLEDELKALHDERYDEIDRLHGEIGSGNIDQRFYSKEPGASTFNFKDPTNRLKFRNTFESDNAINEAAEGYYHTIMNQTAEQTNAQVMNTMLGKSSENPLKQRSLLIPDRILYDGKMLSKNLGAAVANYTTLLGRRTWMKNIYHDVTFDGGIGELVEQLRKEYIGDIEKLNERLLKARDSKNKKEITKLEKEIVKRDNQFKSDKEDMALSHNKMMGQMRGDYKANKWTAFARNFAVTLKLGAVPLTMVTDLMAIPMKHGFWPTVRDGLLPILKNMKTLIQEGKGENYIENAPHALLGLNHTLTAYQNRMWAGSMQPYTPISGRLQNGMENLAHISQNIAGTNQVENFLQEWTASVVQAKIMRYMVQHLEGKLKPKDKQKLLVYGLDPDKHAKTFVEQWTKAGKDGNGFGGIQSRFWEWEDKAAANLMAEKVMQGTRDTVIRRGMFDAPFALDDPFIATMFMFKGWVTASMTRYTVPLMQRPDSEKMIGAMLMLAAGSMVTPLRRLVKGQDPIQEDDNMFMNAMIDGGVFSLPMDLIETANVFSGGAIFKDISNDRYRERSIAGLIAGPVAGIADDLARVIRMGASGHANQQDMNRLARLIPFLQSWQLRGFSNKMVESMDLPKNARQAEKQNQ